MRANDFIAEAADLNVVATVATVLSLVQSKILEKQLEATLPTSFVMRLINNTGMTEFNYQDLIKANESNDAIKSIVKNITPDKITFSTHDSEQVSNPDEYTSSVDNPEKTVSSMAKKALKRRQS